MLGNSPELAENRQPLMVAFVRSKNNVPIRLTDERWTHITEEHCELAGMRADVLETITQPARIYAGTAGERLAARQLGVGKWLVVVYRELESENGGFVIYGISDPQNGFA